MHWWYNSKVGQWATLVPLLIVCSLTTTYSKEEKMFDHMMIADAFYWMDTVVSPVLTKMFWMAVYWYIAIVAVSAVVGVSMFLYLKWKEGRQKTTAVALAVTNRLPTTQAQQEPPSPTKTNVGMETVMILVIHLFMILAIIMVALLVNPANSHGFSWKPLLAIYVIHTYFSIQSVDTNEFGLLTFYGKPIKNLTSGPVYVPVGLFQIDRFPRNVIQMELPQEPENIYRGDSEIIPEGKVPPTRIAFGAQASPGKDEIVEVELTPGTITTVTISKDDPYNRRLTVEVPFIVAMQIDDPAQFKENVGSVENAMKRLEDDAIAMLNVEMAQITPAVANLRLNQLNKKLKETINVCVKDWGVTIVDAKIKPFGFSHKLNEAVRDNPVAELRAYQKVIEAKAAAEEKELDGTAVANNIAKSGTARAKAATAMATAIQTPGGQTAAVLGAATTAFENADYSLMPDNNVFGVAAGIQKTLQNFGKDRTDGDKGIQTPTLEGDQQPPATPVTPVQPHPTPPSTNRGGNNPRSRNRRRDRRK